ncbi:hypothetical protein D3C79_791920 [compost metagenome]
MQIGEDVVALHRGHLALHRHHADHLPGLRRLLGKHLRIALTLQTGLQGSQVANHRFGQLQRTLHLGDHLLVQLSRWQLQRRRLAQIDTQFEVAFAIGSLERKVLQGNLRLRGQ